MRTAIRLPFAAIRRNFGAEVHLFFDDGIASACLSRKRSTPCFCAKVSKASDHLSGQRHGSSRGTTSANLRRSSI
jgi:hypothetical protein